MLAYEAWKALDHIVGPIKRKRRSWEVEKTGLMICGLLLRSDLHTLFDQGYAC
jgi:hypothetical protein